MLYNIVIQLRRHNLALIFNKLFSIWISLTKNDRNHWEN